MGGPPPSPVYAHATGSLAEGRSLIGKKSQPVAGPFPVDEIRIEQFRAMIQMPTQPSFATPEGADAAAGQTAPPASLQIWVRQLPWSEEGETPRSMLATAPLPGTSMINISTDIVYDRPIRVGDTLSVQDEIVSISDLKKTVLGDGHFVTAIAHYRNQKDELIATCTNVLFRFDPRQATS